MKTRSVIIMLLLVAFAQTAFSQAVRWRFTIPATAYQKDLTHAAIIANDGTGGALFLVSDYRFYPPGAGINGLESVGSRILWLDRTGALLHSLTIEGEHFHAPSPILLTQSFLLLELRNDSGAVTGYQRVARTRNGVKVTDLALPSDETVARGPALSTADDYGYFTFKITRESVTQIVRYSP